MGLQCGIIGITNIGKTTIFNCISETKVVTSNFAFSTNKSNRGQVKVPDERLHLIDNFIHSAKIIPTSIEIIDIPGLAKGASQGEGIGNSFLADIRNCDALIHVVRCFDDENLVHIDQTIDPVRDKEAIDFELQVKDLESIEKRMAKWEKTAKSGDKTAKNGMIALEKCKNHLEDFQSLRSLEMDADIHQYIDDLALLSIKPVMYVCNVEDESAINGNHHVDKFKDAVKAENTEVIIIAGKIESEIAELEDEDDRVIFLKDIGLEVPG
ncbi:MAG: redox-regulated ATPase YchF, partial [Bacteroidetes bacterium]|nr:redox-regulated ATPase YchF [Bacteroidota bacterium]